MDTKRIDLQYHYRLMGLNRTGDIISVLEKVSRKGDEVIFTWTPIDSPTELVPYFRGTKRHWSVVIDPKTVTASVRDRNGTPVHEAVPAEGWNHVRSLQVKEGKVRRITWPAKRKDDFAYVEYTPEGCFIPREGAPYLFEPGVTAWLRSGFVYLGEELECNGRWCGGSRSLQSLLVTLEETPDGGKELAVDNGTGYPLYRVPLVDYGMYALASHFGGLRKTATEASETSDPIRKVLAQHGWPSQSLRIAKKEGITMGPFEPGSLPRIESDGAPSWTADLDGDLWLSMQAGTFSYMLYARDEPYEGIATASVWVTAKTDRAVVAPLLERFIAEVDKDIAPQIVNPVIANPDYR